MQPITPFLWFDANAEEAARFYVETFANAPVSGSRGDSRIISMRHKGKVTPGPGDESAVLLVNFSIHGQEFTGLNGGPNPDFKFSPGISFTVACASQEEIDYFWDAFTKKGGEELECGWCRDRYGLTWQIVPSILPELTSDQDPEKADRVMSALFKMKKLDIATLKAA